MQKIIDINNIFNKGFIFIDDVKYYILWQVKYKFTLYGICN